MKYRLSILFLLIWALAQSQARAVEVKAIAEIDKDSILIGDQFNLSIKVTADKDTKITWPRVAEELEGPEVVSESKYDTVNTDAMMEISKTYVLTCFDEGNYSVPAFTVMYAKPGSNSLYPAKTNSFVLKVSTIEKLDEDIRDIKDILDEPMTFMDYLPYIIIAVILLIVLIILFIYFRKFRKTEQKDEGRPQREEPKIPAHILAIAALDKLESEELWQKGQVKDYHIRLTEIVRTYIERRYTIIALEMTTDEIIDDLRKFIKDEELIKKLYELLALADLSKFAKFNPQKAENENSLAVSYEFINKTKTDERN